jgi:hypothetical protein
MVMCAAPAAPTRRSRTGAAVAAGTGILWVGGALPAVGLDEALDEFVDVARLGQVPLGQQVAQFGLGQAFVALAGPCVSLPGVLALSVAGLACQLLLGLLGLRGLLAGGPLGVLSLLAGDVTGRLGLSRTMSPADSACSRTAPDSVPAASAHLTARRRLMSTVRCTRSK